MPSSYTSSLRLTLPATGELSGQWGSVVNQGITELLDSAVAGTASISTWGGAGVAYTLSSTSGAADEARKMFIVASGSPGEAKNVICPAVSKFYVFRNDTTGGFALTLKTPSGTGISVPAGQYKFLYCDGTNVVEMFNSAGALSLSGNLTLSGGTANGVLYLNGSKVATSGSALTFDGTNLGLGTASPSGAAGTTFAVNGGASQARFALKNTASGDASGDGFQIALLADGVNVVYQNRESGYQAWELAGSEQMRLTSTGLGIGTSSPGYPLQVRRAGGAGSLGITVDSVGSINRVAQYYSIGDTTAVTTGHAWYTRNASATDNLSLLLDNSGNLGLGMAPSAWASNRSVFQLKGGTSSGGAYMVSGSATQVLLGTNAYSNGTNFIYLTSAQASLYDQTLGAHYWYTAASGTAGNTISFTQAMTLDASGNLGVGPTSPSAKLHVGTQSGGVAAPTQLRLDTSYASTATPTNQQLKLALAYISATEAYGFALDNLSGIWYHSGNTTGPTGNHIFATGGSERARITSGGYAKFSPSGVYSSGATTPAHSFDQSDAGYYSLYVYHTASATANAGINVTYPNRSPNGTGDNFLICSDSTTVRAAFRSNGGLANYSGNDANLSDRREKTNFAPAKSYLDTICAIPVQTFNYIDQSPDDPGLTLGVVAQDVQAVAPELVMESNWGTEDNPKMRLSIYQTDLQYALMKAIQEQQALITALTARVAALEAQP